MLGRLVGLLSIVGLVACSHSQRTQANEAGKLLEADRAFASASLNQGTAQAFFSQMSDDAIQLPADAPAVQGRSRIRERMELLGAQVLDWTPRQAQVSASLDLGWTWGDWRLYESAESRRPVAHGKYLNIWKRQPDGSWKLAADIGNAARESAAAGP